MTWKELSSAQGTQYAHKQKLRIDSEIIDIVADDHPLLYTIWGEN